MPKALATFDVEYTDTFGGEANYCWVRRYTIEAPCDISERALMRRAKALCGLTGARGRTYWNGDYGEFRPYIICTVLFINPRY